MLSFFPLDVLDEILNLIESVSEGFTSYSFIHYIATYSDLVCIAGLEKMLVNNNIYILHLQ